MRGIKKQLDSCCLTPGVNLVVGLTELSMKHGANVAAWRNSKGEPHRRLDKIEQVCIEQTDEVAGQIWELECSLKKSEGQEKG